MICKFKVYIVIKVQNNVEIKSNIRHVSGTCFDAAWILSKIHIFPQCQRWRHFDPMNGIAIEYCPNGAGWKSKGVIGRRVLALSACQCLRDNENAQSLSAVCLERSIASSRFLIQITHCTIRKQSCVTVYELYPVIVWSRTLPWSLYFVVLIETGLYFLMFLNLVI